LGHDQSSDPPRSRAGIRLQEQHRRQSCSLASRAASSRGSPPPGATIPAADRPDSVVPARRFGANCTRPRSLVSSIAVQRSSRYSLSRPSRFKRASMSRLAPVLWGTLGWGIGRREACKLGRWRWNWPSRTNRWLPPRPEFATTSPDGTRYDGRRRRTSRRLRPQGSSLLLRYPGPNTSHFEFCSGYYCLHSGGWGCPWRCGASRGGLMRPLVGLGGVLVHS
jgi:hypothetical protein